MIQQNHEHPEKKMEADILQKPDRPQYCLFYWKAQNNKNLD